MIRQNIKIRRNVMLKNNDSRTAVMAVFFCGLMEILWKE